MKKSKVWLMGTIVLLTIFVSLGISIYLNINEEYSHSSEEFELVGLATSTIVSIISLIISIIGITISLQNESCFGISFSKIYLLRVDKYFKFSHLIILSVLLCVLCFICYACDLYIGAIGVMIATLIFGLYICSTELPLLMKEDKAIINIIKRRLYYNYKNEIEAEKDLKETVKYMIINLTLSETYEKLKVDNEDYNKYLIEKLLEYQCLCAFELKNIGEKQKVLEIADSLSDNVFSILYHNNKKFSNFEYEECFKNQHFLMRVLLELSETQEGEISKRTFFRFSELPFMFSISEKEPIHTKHLLRFVPIMVAISVKKGNLVFIKALRRYYSNLDHTLQENGITTTLFGFLSMYMYYLCDVEPDYPTQLKNDLRNFIDQSGIEEDALITSWRNLFSSFADTFLIELKDLIELFDLCGQNSFDYLLCSWYVHTVVFTERFISNWYFANLLNSRRIYDYDLEKKANENDNVKESLISFLNKCFKEDKLNIPDNIVNIVKFYILDEEPFFYIHISDEKKQELFNYLNKFNLEEVIENVKKAKQLKNETLETELYDYIQHSLRSEWGYNSNLPVDSDTRIVSLFQEKFAEAHNFKETVFKLFVKSIKRDIYDHTKHLTIYKSSDFASHINDILNENWDVVSSKRKALITHLIKQPDTRTRFENLVDTTKEIKSGILRNLSFVSKDGFEFNFELIKVTVRELSKKELDEVVNKYQREDGQYVYDGVFMPQEKIIGILKDRCAIFEVLFKFSVKSLETSIIEINPFEEEK